MKQYRLKIPEKTLSNCAAVIAELNMYEKVDWIISYQQLNELERRYDFMVPKYWLEEIKDEPMSAEESLEKNHPKVAGYDREKICQHTIGFEEGYVSGFHDGAAENEKMHRMRHSFEEWHAFRNFKINKDNEMFDSVFCRREGWNAHAKATNTEA